MNKTKAIKIIDNFLEGQLKSEKWYQDIRSEIKAIILYGSVAKGTNREDSDIDILFILLIEIEKKYTKGEYTYKYENHNINIVMRSIEKLRDIANGEHDSFQAEVFRKSKIVWQKDDDVSELIRIICKKKLIKNH